MKNCPRLLPSKYDLLVVAAVLLLASAVAVCFWGGAGDSGEMLTAVVTIDGAEVDRFTLAQIREEERTYTNNGITLTAAGCATVLQNGESLAQKEIPGVRVVASDCPTQDCVHTGQIDKAGQSIVCLPAHIVITLVGGNADYDLIVG